MVRDLYSTRKGSPDARKAHQAPGVFECGSPQVVQYADPGAHHPLKQSCKMAHPQLTTRRVTLTTLLLLASVAPATAQEATSTRDPALPTAPRRAEAPVSGKTARLPLRRRGSSFFVEVQVKGQRVLLLVDTGASLTSLTPTFARAVGALPDKNAPQVTIRTGNGRKRETLGLLPALRLGGHTLRNVTFSVDHTHEQERVDGLPLVGLVGMNVLMRFRVTLDGDQGVLELTPGARYADPLLDAQHWVDADTSISRTVEGETGKVLSRTMRSKLTNLSKRPLDGVRVRYTCARPDGSEATFDSAPTALTPRTWQTVDTVVPPAAQCARVHDAQLIEARWR